MSTASFTKKIEIRTDAAADVLIEMAEQRDREQQSPAPIRYQTVSREQVARKAASARAANQQG